MQSDSLQLGTSTGPGQQPASKKLTTTGLVNSRSCRVWKCRPSLDRARPSCQKMRDASSPFTTLRHKGGTGMAAVSCWNFLCRCCSSASLTLTAHRPAVFCRCGHLADRSSSLPGCTGSQTQPVPLPPRHRCRLLEDALLERSLLRQNPAGSCTAPTAGRCAEHACRAAQAVRAAGAARLHPQLSAACCPTWCSSCRQSSAAATCRLHPAPGWGS